MSDVEGPLKSASIKHPAETGQVDATSGQSHDAHEVVGLAHMHQLQRLVGNHVVAGLVESRAPVLRLAAQRKVFTEGSKAEGAVAVPASVKDVAKWVINKTSVEPGGKNYIADVQGHGPGFKKGKNEFVGGSVYKNYSMPDGSRLPYANGQTYQEWDTEPCTEGAARGAARVVTSDTGKAYYSADHYANFTEFAT
jgi:guanyl-specific ribonuclease Sa